MNLVVSPDFTAEYEDFRRYCACRIRAMCHGTAAIDLARRSSREKNSDRGTCRFVISYSDYWHL